MASPTLEKTKTPGIYKRGGRYVVVYRDPHGRQRKAFAKTMSEARDLKATRRADIARGEYRQLSRVTFAEYAPAWVESYRGRTRRGVGEGTRSDYRDALERDAIPFFGAIRLAAIEPRDVKQYATGLAGRGLAPASVTKAVAPVRALFADALEEGLIRSNPAAGLRLAHRVENEDEDEHVKALTGDELARLLAELPEVSRPFFRFLFETGLRISEVIEVRHGDVQLGERCWLSVERQFYRGKVTPPKGGKRRRVPLSTETARALWAQRKHGRCDENELLFAAERGGRIIPSNLMRRVLKPAAVRAGLGEWVGQPARAESWVGFHSLRHSCATSLFRSGWNAVQVQKFLGHSDPGFTLRTYVHLLDEDLPHPDFAPMRGNAGATRPTQTGRNEAVAEAAASGL